MDPDSQQRDDQQDGQQPVPPVVGPADTSYSWVE
jgi:hypothetical protein